MMLPHMHTLRCVWASVSWCVTVSPVCVQREIRCNKEGKWTAEFSMCSSVQGSCPPPPDLNSVEYSCDQGTDVGERSPHPDTHAAAYSLRRLGLVITRL